MTHPIPEFPGLPGALHPLGSAPSGPGWNQSELLDLLPIASTLVEAAVLVGLVPKAEGTQVILTRRIDTLRHHGGQVSFPGGRQDPDDRDAAAAAIREAGEEIGIRPDQILPLGYLDPLMTITGFRIVPLVARVDPAYKAQPDPREVAAVFEVPLRFLLDPAHLATHVLDFQGRSREVLEFRYPAQRIWGATASMLFNLRARLEALR